MGVPYELVGSPDYPIKQMCMIDRRSRALDMLLRRDIGHGLQSRLECSAGDELHPLSKQIKMPHHHLLIIGLLRLGLAVVTPESCFTVKPILMHRSTSLASRTRLHLNHASNSIVQRSTQSRSILQTSLLRRSRYS